MALSFLIDFGDLKQLSTIGEGKSRSTAYKVVHQPTGRYYALKQLCDHDELSDQGRQEIEILRDLNHPIIMKLFQVFVEDGKIFLLLEYVDCNSLQGTHITDESILADLALQVLSGLHYLHRRMLVHGNIRPSKIFMNSENKVKVAYLGEILSSYNCSSTVAYKGPEATVDSVVDLDTMYKMDVWSLGLSILELVLGRFPYDQLGKDAEQVVISWTIYHSKPPQAPLTVSTELRHFISCCLQKNPGKRWTTKQLLSHPFILQDKSGKNPQEMQLTAPLLRSSTEQTIRQHKLFERALHLFPEDSPDRWEKLAAIVGEDKAAEDVKNYYKVLADAVKRIEANEEDQKHDNKPGYKKCPTYAPLKTRLSTAKPGVTRVFVSDLCNFPNRVIQLTGCADQEPDEFKEKRTKYILRGEKDSERLDPSADSEFENLPEDVKKCLIYCSLFPLDYEFEKDALVQLWIAEELIDVNGKERMEDQFSACFDILAYKGYIVPSSFDNVYGQQKYKINESKASYWYLERDSSRESYMRIESALDDKSRMALHLSLQCDKLDQAEFSALRSCKHLRTLLFAGDYGSSTNDVPRDLFLCLKSLRTLDLSRIHISGLPTSVGCLESLHYLDLSYSPIKRLPESIDCLYNLQTLKLRGCFALCALPEGIRKLINLRHLDFDIVRQLNSMPKGMGSLTKLQTLKAFLVGSDNGCSVAELKNMDNITGSFCISRLENVKNAEDAKKAALSNKQYITKLELRWTDHANHSSQDEEEILEYLQPHPSLKELQLLFYNGSSLPSWICHPSFRNCVSITLYKCKNCSLLTSIGELLLLRFLKIVEMDSVREINRTFCGKFGAQGSKAFPKLEKLTIDNMLNLEEWTGVENGDFPSLLQLLIQYCPKLYDLQLLSRFRTLKYLEISHCSSLQSLPEEALPPSLDTLIIKVCPKVKERCNKDQGEDWWKIAHVPRIWMDDEEVCSIEVEESITLKRKRKEVEDLSQLEKKDKKLRRVTSL